MTVSVVVYVKKPDETGICPYCIQAKEWLADRNIEFKLIELEAPERRALYDDLGLINENRSVPQVILRDDDGVEERIGGYQELVVSGIESLFRSASR